MTPEILKLQQQIDDLKSRLDLLNNNATIPFDVGEAMKARITSDAGLVVNSNLGATGHNRSVNEAGGATYSVMGIPTGFVEVMISGITKYIPYF